MKVFVEPLLDNLVVVAVGMDVVGRLLAEWQRRSAIQVVVLGD